MLDTLRKAASGWIAQLFIALLVVSFAVWGVSDIFTGFRGDTVATVGGTDVSVQSFAREYDLARRQLSQRAGQQITPEQARLYGVPTQVLGRLVTQATLDDEAATLGLGISSQTLAMQIADDPNFQNSSGAFDRTAFAAILSQNNLTEDQYIEQLRSTYIRQQLVDALAGAPRVPEAYLKAYHEYRTEERKIAYVVLGPGLVGDVGEPTDTDLTAYFDANKAAWRAPELRTVNVMRMAPEDLADTGAIDEAEARRAYDADLAGRYTTAEQRRIEQIVFRDQADADKAAASLAAGKTFDDLLAERQLTPASVDLGLITRDKILDPKVAEAAFGLPAGGVSPLVAGRFGPVMVRVTTIEPAVVQPFDAVKAAILAELAQRRAGAEIADQLDVIEDARAGGDTLADIAGKYDLKVETFVVDSTGKDADGNAVAIPGAAALVTAAFDSDVGIENDPIGLAPSGYAWYEVTAVTAERDRQLADVRDRVIAAWKQDQVGKRLTERAEAMRARLAAGEQIATIAVENGLSFQTDDKVTRQTQPSGDLSAAAIQATFGGPKGYAAVADGTAPQSKVVLIVNDVVLPPFVATAPEMAQAGEEIGTAMTTDLMQQYVGQLQERLGIRVNQAAIDAVLSITPGT